MPSPPVSRASEAYEEILTLPELAKLLRVAEKTVYTMAQGAELPGFKVRGQWRFRRRDIDQWIAGVRELDTKGQLGRGRSCAPKRTAGIIVRRNVR